MVFVSIYFCPISSAAQMSFQIQQTLKIMRWGKYINVKHRRAHPARDGLIVSHSQQRIQPDQFPYSPLDSAEFFGKDRWISGLPSIAQNHEHGIAGKEPPSLKLY